MTTDKPEKPPERNPPSRVNDFLRYSSLGLQLLITLAIAGGLGFFIDSRIGWKFPAFLMLFILIALAGSIYLLIKKTE